MWPPTTGGSQDIKHKAPVAAINVALRNHQKALFRKKKKKNPTFCKWSEK